MPRRPFRRSSARARHMHTLSGSELLDSQGGKATRPLHGEYFSPDIEAGQRDFESTNSMLESATQEPLTQSQREMITVLDEGEDIFLLSNAACSFLLRYHLLHVAITLDPKSARALKMDTFHPDSPRQELCSQDADPEAFLALGHDFYVLSTLGRDISPGITKWQFEYIFSRCAACARLCYKEREAVHLCPARTSMRGWEGAPEDLFRFLLTYMPNHGLSDTDICCQFVFCGLCDRICMARRLAVHECPSRIPRT
ncbi:hypothetical protein NMY22_g13047 [Coprinellus aureogranulatus]|nr:hypothetical protein NMY22_g13047 [Coprinellus aureogranulatus]